jgi:hypothetical protein
LAIILNHMPLDRNQWVVGSGPLVMSTANSDENQRDASARVSGRIIVLASGTDRLMSELLRATADTLAAQEAAAPA